MYCKEAKEDEFEDTQSTKYEAFQDLTSKC